MKRVLAFCLGLATLAMASLAVTGTATAENLGPNGEVASSSFGYKSLGDGFYKSTPTPAEWKINVEVTEPPPAPPATVKDILPLKRVKVNLGKDVSFNPDPKMPVCGADKVGPPPINMSVPPQDVIARCPKSVIGNGTADLYLGHKNNGSGPNLSKAKGTAAVLVVFNGGRDKAGNPVIKIYGYSKATTAGIFMETALQKDGTLDIAVPPLSADSAVGRFDLDIPGTTPIEYDYKKVPQSVGQDRNYFQAKCSTGSWSMSSEFTLGTRDSAGNPTSPDTVLTAPTATDTCVGKSGSPKAKLGGVKVKGPGSAKAGKTVTYKVTVKNTGKTTATGVKVTAKGKGAKGSGNGGTIPAGKSKTVKVKVKFAKKGTSKVTFTAKAKNGGSAKAAKTVKVK